MLEDGSKYLIKKRNHLPDGSKVTVKHLIII